MTTRPPLDPAVVDSLRQLTPPGEPDVLAEILSVFLTEVPRRVDRLKSAFRDRDAAEVQRAAHSLKGSSGNIGADGMFEVCRQIDERAKAGDLGIDALLDGLDREYRNVEAEIRRILQNG